MPLHSYISIKHFHKKSVLCFHTDGFFSWLFPLLFHQLAIKSDAFLLNRETIPLQMELIPAKIGMDKHFWHGIGCLERIAIPKKSAPVFLN